MAVTYWAGNIIRCLSGDTKPSATTYTGFLLTETDTNALFLPVSGVWTEVGAGGSHPDLSTHDAMGIATDTELGSHVSDGDPHTGYVLESAHGGVTPAGHHAAESGESGTHTHGNLYYTETEHGGVSPQGHHAAESGVSSTHTHSTDHTRLHTVTQTLDHTFPGGTTTYLRADGTFATPPSGGGSWTTIIKTADQARTNNTLADDDTLKFTTLANTQYVIRLAVHMITNATADSKYRMAHTGTTTRVRRRIVRTATTDIPAEVITLAAFDAADVVLSTTGAMPFVEEFIVLQVGAVGGVLSFKWAQNTTNASPMTVLEGSYLEYATS